MKDSKIQDGTWTHRITTFKDGIWRTIIEKDCLTDDRFQRARFVFDGGPTVLVSAEDLRRVCDVSKAQSELGLYWLYFDLEKSTLNDQSVHFETEA